MKNKLKISPLLFVATALCFLLPFLTISSGGNKLGSFSGVRVATGISVNAPEASEGSQQDKFAADPMAVFAVLCILIGFAMSFVATGRLAIYPAIAGVIGTAAMVGARASFANQVAKQTGGALQVNMQPGFYLALLFMVAAAAWEAYEFLQHKPLPVEEDLVPSSAFGGPIAVHESIAEPKIVETEVAAPVNEPSSVVEPPATTVEEETVVCSHCGTTLNANARFCTACGKPVGTPAIVDEPGVVEPIVLPVPEPPPTPSAIEPAAIAVQPVALPVPEAPLLPLDDTIICSHCGATLNAESHFCNVCGKPVSAAAAVNSPAPVAPLVVVPVAEPIAAPNAPPPVVEALPAPVPLDETIICSHCGATLDASTRFCTVCGKPVGVPGSPVPVEQPIAMPAPAPPVIASPNQPPVESEILRPAITAPPSVLDAPRSARRPIAAIAGMLLVVVLLIAAAAGWYFWGVDTVVVCSPYDAKVFLDGVQLNPDSPGRFTIPHLPRGPHTLKVQKDGYGESFLNLDFPITTVSEWVNVRLTPLAGGPKGLRSRAP